MFFYISNRSLGEKIRDSISLNPSGGKTRRQASDSNLLRNGSSSDSASSAIEDVLKSTKEALAAAISSTECEAAARARAEAELDSTLEELIDVKVRFAHVASELDVERVRTMKLRDKLRLYAETLTSLEVRLTGQKNGEEKALR